MHTFHGTRCISGNCFECVQFDFSGFQGFHRKHRQQHGSFWHSQSTYSTASGYNPHTGSQSITAGDGTVYSGEWIQLSMPYQIHLKRIGVSPRTTNYNRGPHTATLLARRNGIDWVVVSSWGSLVWTTTEASNGVLKYIEVNSEQPYSEFVMVVHLSNDSVNLNRMVFFGVPHMTVDDARQLNVGQVMTSSVGIGTSAPHAPLTVFGQTGGTTSAAIRYWYQQNTTNASSSNSTWSPMSIYAHNSIITQQSFVASLGTLQASDRRIKTNIADVNDSSALETFRLLQPKLYNYKDVVQRGSLGPVWGFIAQEVGNTLHYSTDRRTEYGFRTCTSSRTCTRTARFWSSIPRNWRRARLNCVCTTETTMRRTS